MRLLLDTNILMYFSKDSNLELFSEIIGNENHKIFASVVSMGELKSISIQNNWGNKRIQKLDGIFDNIAIVEVNQNLVETYAEIDAFSQCRHPSYQNQPFSTPRNMGKNDLWIASTAALLGLKLITTDKDFNHLHDVFIEVQYLTPEELK